MSKSRHFSVLSIAALFVLLLAATGWCGGPVDASRGQAAPMGPWGGTTQAAPTQTAFNLSGGVGSGNANGVDSASPWVNFASLGIHNAFAWNVRGTYTPVRLFPNVRIGLDYMNVKFTGSTNNYTGAWHPILLNGQGAEGRLDLGLWSLTGDWMPPLVNNAITIGPRVQWMLLNDRFELTNTTTNNSGVDNKTRSMYGIGFAGVIDFARLAGGGMGMIDPYIKFAASVGAGAKVRYYNYEIFVSIFKGDGSYDTMSSGFWRFPRLGVGVDLGYVHYGFASYDEEDEVYAGWVPGTYVRPKSLRYDLGVPYIRGTVTF